MLAAVAQVIAAAAVIPSVIYLAIQISNQNTESRRTAANVIMLHWIDFRKSLAENGELAAIHLRGLESFDDLSPVEKLRFGSALGRLFVLCERVYLFYLEGVIAQDLWRTFEQTTADLIAFPGAQAWWPTRKHWHTPQFQALVDQMIAQGAKPTLYESYTKSRDSDAAPTS